MTGGPYEVGGSACSCGCWLRNVDAGLLGCPASKAGGPAGVILRAR
jgi:hypothetical protein